MGAQGNVLSKVYKIASLKALKYFGIAYSERRSILSVLGEEDDDFGTMLEILRKGGTSNAKYLESIVKPLEKAGLLSCDYAGDYCKVTDEGIKAFEGFMNAANTLDTILGSISKLGMEAFNKEYVIPESVKHLRKYKVFILPFIPKGYTNPFIEAFIETFKRANGNPSYFISQIVSFYHPFVFLLIADYIIYYKKYYEDYVLTCKYLPYSTEKEIKEVLSGEGRYPTGKEIKEMLKYYAKEYMEELKKHGISVPKSPLQPFVSLRLIKNLRNEAFYTFGTFNRYKEDRYDLTKKVGEGDGEGLAEYIALHILLS